MIKNLKVIKKNKQNIKLMKNIHKFFMKMIYYYFSLLIIY